MARSIDTLSEQDPTYVAPLTVQQKLAGAAATMAKAQQDVASGDPSYAASLYRAGERGGFTPATSYDAIASAPIGNPFRAPSGSDSLSLERAAEANRIAAAQASTVKQKMFDGNVRAKALQERIALKAGAKVADSFMKVYEDNPGFTEDQAYDALRLDKKYNQPYLERFSGNQTLVASGKNPLTMEEYFTFEDTIKEYSKAYDMPALAEQGRLNTLIGQGLDAATATSVIDNVYAKVLKQKDVLDSFKKYYPELSTGDIVSSVLLGTKNQADVSILNKKIAAAQIGGAAAAQGLTVGMGTAAEQAALASEYANNGLTQSGELSSAALSKAQDAYATIATELPGLQTLGNVFGKQTGDAANVKPGQNVYTQTMSENADIKGLASAQRAKQKLIQYGRDIVSGDTGIDTRSFIGSSGQY